MVVADEAVEDAVVAEGDDEAAKLSSCQARDIRACNPCHNHDMRTHDIISDDAIQIWRTEPTRLAPG